MHASLTFGPTSLHVLTVVPGRAGEARRVAEHLVRLEPYAVAAELDASHALSLRQRLAGARSETPFIADLLVRATASRHRGEVDDVFAPAARHSRDDEVPFLPLLPNAEPPGFFERRRLRRIVEALTPGKDDVSFVESAETALRSEGGRGAERAAQDSEAARRLARLLFEEDRTRLVAILTVARADRILEGLRARAPRRTSEVPRERAVAEVSRDEPYPAYR